MDFTNEMIEMRFLEIAEALDALNSEMYCVEIACSDDESLVHLLKRWREKALKTATKARQCAEDVVQ